MRLVGGNRFLEIAMPSRWKSVIISDFSVGWYKLLPEVAACYAIYKNSGELVYIGSTKNLSERMAGHRHGGPNGKPRSSMKISEMRQMVIKYKTSKRYGEWLMTEARLIRRLKPPLNFNGRPRKSVGRPRCGNVHTGRVFSNLVLPVPDGGYEPRYLGRPPLR